MSPQDNILQNSLWHAIYLLQLNLAASMANSTLLSLFRACHLYFVVIFACLSAFVLFSAKISYLCDIVSQFLCLSCCNFVLKLSLEVSDINHQHHFQLAIFHLLGHVPARF